MLTKKRILFIANEMSPYLELTEFSRDRQQVGNKKQMIDGFEV